MKYDTMKSALKRIFPSKPLGNENDDENAKAINIKAEAYYANRKYFGQRQFFKPDMKNKQYNPKNKLGEISRCAVCDSKMHWADKCPHNPRHKSVHVAEGIDDPRPSKCQPDSDEEVVENPMEFVNAIFLTECQDNEIYVTETSGCAILDTACTKTVCGESWFSDYVDKLDDNFKKSVKIQKGGTGFKFGDGREVISTKSVMLPAIISGALCYIKADVVKDKLPLLLSKSTLKKAGTTINLENDEAIMLGKPVELQFTTNGHYCIDIHPCQASKIQQRDRKDVFTSSIYTKSDKEMRKEILKLHKQFGHASEDNLIRLIKTGNKSLSSDITSIIREVTNECEICLLHKRAPPRPVVGLPRSNEVNETVALDLHQLGPSLWYLHVIDEFSRYSNAALIHSKSPKIIIQKFLQFWVSIFGAPRRVISDNGGEFNNEEFRDMCENFNISVKTTPAYSPWSNGVCERHNQILTNILIKIKKDVQCNWETALAWSVCAKNSLVNNSGFSPTQIMFGRNINLPSVMKDDLPALEGKTISEKVGEHINTLHASRKAFIEAESSQRIRRALRSNTRPYSGNFEIGEDVYYKRNDSNEWKGPGRVLGKDGVLVFLRHGGQLIRAHTSRVQKLKQNNNSLNHVSRQIDEQQSEISNDTDYEKTEISQVEETALPETLQERHPDSSEEQAHIPCQSCNEEPSYDQVHNMVLKKNQMVTFKNDGILCEAEILNRAGKATGKYRNCFNVEYKSPSHLSGVKHCVDFDQVQELQVIPPQQESMVLNNVRKESHVFVTEDIDFDEAKAKELQSWQENDVFDECANEGQKCISVKWVCSLKNTDKGILPKARLVARGFEDPDIDNVEKDSPTCSKDALRTVIAITAQKGWRLQSIDIKTAFLQGEKLQRNVYLIPPREAKCMPGKIWRLKKCVYGLTDASLQWYGRVKRFMLENKGKMTKNDPAVFCWHEAKSLQGIIAVHVDDFLWAGTVKFQQSVLPKLRETFKIGNEESKSFKYIGIEIDHDKNEVLLNQTEYISNLTPIKIHSGRNSDDSVTIKERDELRSKIGQFLWVSGQTRPDIAYDVCILATNFKNATVRDLFLANKVLRKLKSNPFSLKFQNLGPNENLNLVCYTDASFASLNDGGSQSGSLVFLVGESGYCNLLSWESKRIRRVVKSSLAAETLALSNGIDTAAFVASLFAEIWNGDINDEKLPIELVIDNLSLYEAIKSNKQVQDKRLRVDIAIVKEMIKNKEVSNVYWVEGKLQLADTLTKSGVSSSKLVDILCNGQF
uniref:uncharacterized protein LOC120339893 n=1 Tax=Styela clava TaxID=7725 RepID=UPI001939C0F8|nr:uncharacterized protein LOC120339893 [Styela clava]